MVNTGGVRVAPVCDRSYLNGREPEGFEMPAAISPLVASRPLLLAALVVGLLLAGTLALWAYQGTAVFFEMVRTGWASCF
jgi:hypothetical protein